MFWFDKNHPNALYQDIRSEDNTLIAGRPEFSVQPDSIADFRNMPYPDNHFKLVVFDPPHLKTLGKTSWMAKKYGKLFDTWEDDIKRGFDECMRVLAVHGTLIFKWNESEITVSKLLEVIGQQPLFGHTTGRQSKTMWMAFMKMENNPS